ncbi:glycosyltransferase [Salinicoccus albus]|uniref:glycosyltransferase n=1 Tax=Salinicoccus albus TaxID=418756 RepID=UPI0003671711|nr:glycosyltransferase [Salinicoccus albus]
MSTNKHVVHLTTVHHPYDPRIYHKECRSLQNAGFDVTLIAQKAPKGEDGEQPIRHLPLKTYKRRLGRMILGTYDAYRQAKKMDADVYHFHDPELLPAAWLLKNKGNVVIYDIHEDYVTSIMQKDYMNHSVKRLIAGGYKIAEKFFTKGMGLALAEKYYKDFYPHGVCILNYPMVNEKFARHERSGPVEDKVIYTGNVSHVRGALYHAKLPAIDTALDVHFIGKCPGGLAEEMRSVAEERSDNLHFEGIDSFVEKEDIEDRYLERNWLAGVALFPPTEHYKKKELTKFFEYMNAGLPVICSDFPVWKAFIEKYECGIAVDPEDDAAIKNALDYLKHNPEEAMQMGRNGKEAVTRELNWQSQEKTLIRWYNGLLNQDLSSDTKGGF